MSNKRHLTNHNISRRTAMGATVASLTAVSWTTQSLGAESSDDNATRKSDSSDTKAKPTPFTDGGYRLYCMLESDPYLGAQDKELPAVFGVYTGRLTRPPRDKPHAFVWATKEQAVKIHAIRFEKVFGTPPLEMKSPNDVAVFGSRRQAKHQLYILFGPNAIHKSTPQDATFESIDQIVARWREVTKRIPGLTIEAVQPTPVPKQAAFKSLTIPGQIRVRFEDALPDATLEYFKRHPQTIRMQWAAPFVSLFCPGCGMG